jgi:hypothetical protein
MKKIILLSTVMSFMSLNAWASKVEEDVSNSSPLDSYYSPSTLQELKSSFTSPKRDVVKSLSLDNFRTKELEGENLEQLFQDVLTSFNNLESLDVKYRIIGDQGVKLLSVILERLPTLKKLEFSASGKKIANGIHHLFKALNTNRTLLELRLLNTAEIDSSSWTDLAEALMKNSSLKILYVNEARHIDQKAAKALGESFEGNVTLTNLSITNIFTTEITFQLLISGLKKNNSIVRLELSNCTRVYDGHLHLAELIKMNTTIKVLEFYNNNIDDKGLFIIGESLQENKNLVKIDLSPSSYITETAREEFEERLKEHPSIKEIYIL